MNELDDIRKRRMEELQRQALQENEINSQLAQLESIVKTLLTKEALERYGNVKSAYPDKAVKLLLAIGQMVQKGNINIIDDGQLKQMLVMLEPKKHEIKITRK